MVLGQVACAVAKLLAKDFPIALAGLQIAVLIGCVGSRFMVWAVLHIGVFAFARRTFL